MTPPDPQQASPTANGAPDGGARPGWIAGAVVVGLTLLMGLPSLGRWFDNPDDWDHIDAAQVLLDGRGSAWRDLFLGDAGIASVRPLPTLLWAADRAAWGWNAGGFFLTNLLLVVALAGLVTAVVWRLSRSGWVAAAGGALVGLSVAANQPLYYLASRDDALANVLIAGAVLAWIAGRETSRGRWLTAALAFASALCKPTVALLPLALLAIDRFPHQGRPVLDPQEWLVRQAPVLAALSAYLALLAVALGFAFSGLMPPQEGGAGTALLAVRNALGPHLLPAVMRHENPGMLLVDAPRLAVLGAVAWFGLRAGVNRSLVALGVALFVVGTLPPLPFLAQRGFQVQDAGRYLQLPLVGVALIVCGMLAGARGRAGRGLAAAVVVVSVAACALASVPMLARGFSPARGLFEALSAQADEVSADGELLVGVSRLDAGATSLLGSELLERRLGRRPLLFLQGGERLLRSARAPGERFRYGAFEDVGELSLDGLGPSDRVLWDAVGPDRSPTYLRMEARAAARPGPDRAWELDARQQTWRRLPSHALWRVIELGLMPPVILALPPPIDVDPGAVCGAEVTLTVRPTQGSGPGASEPGKRDALVPSGQFALLLFSEEADPDDPLERWVVLPLKAGAEPQTAHVNLRNAPGWTALRRVRWLAVVPSDRPADVTLEAVRLQGCR